MENEERLKLCLALAEIGEGPENTYSHIIARDLITNYEKLEKQEEGDLLKIHYRNIPDEVSAVNRLDRQERDRQRRIDMEENQTLPPVFKRNKKRRKKR